MTDITMLTAVTYTYGRIKHPVDAQIVGETVQRIESEEGKCSPDRLVDEARPEDSPLHRLFTWDDGLAAESWRRHEARQVINSLTVTVTHNETPVVVPAFLSTGHTKATQEQGTGYRSFDVVVEDKELSDEVQTTVLNRLKTFRQRYADMAPFLGVWSAIDDLELELARRRRDKAA